jgi:hypothetical protein
MEDETSALAICSAKNLYCSVKRCLTEIREIKVQRQNQAWMSIRILSKHQEKQPDRLKKEKED